MSARTVWTISVAVAATLSWLAVSIAPSTQWFEDIFAQSHTNSKEILLSFSSRRVALGDFRWPDKEAWLEGHGFQNNAVVADQIEKLRSYYTAGFVKVSRQCANQFGSAGERISEPTQGNLGCLGWKLDLGVRPKNLKKEIAAVGLNAKKIEVSSVQVDSKINLSKKDWLSLSKQPFRTLLGKFDFESLPDARKIFRVARKSGSQCQEAPARVALQISMEKFLPSREAFSMMENLYQYSKSCLKSDRPGYESMHMRMGLLYVERMEWKKAAAALKNASLADRGIDETRILFWLGFIKALAHYEGDGKFEAHENQWWANLEKAQPLSLHAIAARHLMGRDPADIAKGKNIPSIAVYQGDKWNGRNYWAFLMVLAHAIGDLEMQKALVETQVSYIRTNDFDDSIFYSLTQREAGAKKASFRTVHSGLREFGFDKMSNGVLSLLFPLHYATELSSVEECRDPALALSLIRQESSFEETIVSSRGATGLMQVLPAVAKQRLGKANVNLFSPTENIRAGCGHFNELMNEFENESLMAVAAYNAGSVPVRRWQSRYDKRSLLLFSDLIPFQETRHFVANVFAGDYWYGAVLNAYPQAGFKNSLGLPVGLVPLPDDFGISSAIEVEVPAP